MSRARDWDFYGRYFGGGITFYPYQFAIGWSVRYWTCIFAPSIRLHIGPFKFWLYISLIKSKQSTEGVKNE